MRIERAGRATDAQLIGQLLQTAQEWIRAKRTLDLWRRTGEIPGELNMSGKHLNDGRYSRQRNPFIG
jgi:hypothetical protein